MHWRHKGSHLHNNDASLVSRSAHVLCWQCALALSLSVRGPRRASPAVWLAGFAPLAACLAMTHVAVFRLTPNAAGCPSVTSYAYGLLLLNYHYYHHHWVLCTNFYRWWWGWRGGGGRPWRGPGRIRWCRSRWWCRRRFRWRGWRWRRRK